MQVLKFEIKKILKNNFGALLLPIALLIIILFSIFTSSAKNINMENNKEIYIHILSQYELGGKINDESIERLSSLIASCEDAENQYDKLFYQYQLGNIDISEFELKASELSEKIHQKETLNIISSQYEYASEDFENRYVLYTNGWEYLFGCDASFGFIIFILLTILIVFLNDISPDTRNYFSSLRFGKTKFITSKFIAAGSISLFSYLVYAAVVFIFTFIKYSLSGFNFPVQSIESFSGCQYKISLFVAYLLTVLIRILAVIALTYFSIFLTVVLENLPGSLILNGVLFLIPFLFDKMNFLPQKIMSWQPDQMNPIAALILSIVEIILFYVLGKVFWKRRRKL